MTDGLRVTGLHKRFGDIEALRGIDLEVPRGQLVGFLGPNGAGKTTTMRGVLGLVAMDAGRSVEMGAP
jgi:ABC-2 type transport system ATP-binding protein